MFMGEIVSYEEDYANARVGDRFSFGRYPQGPNGEVEPIAWRVLERESDSLLVISEKGLDAKPYNEKFCDVTWADCTLRRWLNKEFLNKAFSEQEQSLIKMSKLSNNAGPSTDDRIFLLSVYEATINFFADHEDREAKLTAYAISNGARTPSDGEYAGNAWWWLRSCVYNSYCAAGISGLGGVGGGKVDSYGGSVRPALRLVISSTPKTVDNGAKLASEVAEASSILTPKAAGERVDASASKVAESSWSFSPTGDHADKLIIEEARRVLEEYIEFRDGGDILYFGRYPQGANGEVERIAWRVLRYDSDSSLVVADKGLDVKRYNENGRSRIWARCTLRRWLNEEFIKAFNEQELSSILTSKIQSSERCFTKDRIFLLSYDEVQSLFANSNDRICKATDYALSRGADGRNASWWLRSVSNNGSVVAGVDSAGLTSYGGYGFDFDDIVVRPALQLSISKLLF